MDISVNISAGDVEKNVTDKLPVFVANIGWSGSVTKIGQEGDRHLVSGGGSDEHPFQRVDVVAEIACITNTDRISLATFNGGANRFTADGNFHDLVHVLNPQAVAGGRFAINREIKKIASRRSFRKGTPGTRKIR